jgi:hypothetical protein
MIVGYWQPRDQGMRQIHTKPPPLEPGIGFLAKKLGKPPIKSQRLSYQNKM